MMITKIDQLDKKGTYSYADYLTWQLEEMVELIKGKLFTLPPCIYRKASAYSNQPCGRNWQ
jgi:hypothetical protein